MSYTKKVNGFLKKMGGLGPLDEDGECALLKGNAKLVVRVNEGEGLLSVSSPVVRIPPEHILPLFRKLLTLNFERTKDAAFAIDDDTDMVELRIRRPLDHLDFEEFERAVNTVAEVADDYNDVLAEEFGAELAPVGGESSTLKNYLDAINPLKAIEVSHRKRVGSRWLGTICYIAGVLVGIGAGIFCYTQTKSWALLIFVYFWTTYFIGRAVPSLITDDRKFLRFIYFSMAPAFATGVLFLTHWWFDIWWLNVLLGILAGWLIPPLVAMIAMPKILEEETEEDLARLKKWTAAQKSLVKLD